MQNAYKFAGFLLISVFLCTQTWALKPQSSTAPVITSFKMGLSSSKAVNQVAVSELGKLNIASKSNWKVQWSPETGYPLKLSGGRYPMKPGKPDIQVRDFLKQQSKLLGIKADLSDLKDDYHRESLAGYHYTMVQTYQGIHIYGSDISVHLTKDGEVYQLYNHYDPAVKLASVTPSVSQDSAQQAALDYLKVSALQEPVSGELIIFPASEGYKLAWKFTVLSETPFGQWEILIDATNNEVLYLISLSRDLNGIGKVFNPSPVVALRNYTIKDGNNSDTAVSASAYTTVTLQGLSAASSGLYYPKGQYVNCINIENPKSNPPGVSSLTAFIYTRSNTNFEWIMAYYHIDELQRYIQSLGFTNINNRAIKIDAHGLNGADNSHYVVSPAGAGYICYGDGGVDDAEDAEVIVHEYGHAIQDNQKPGFGTTNEAGAIGEGFGDILGAVYFTAFSGGFQDIYCGDWDATSYSTDTPPYLRTIVSTKHYPTDIVNEVHDDGEMWSATIWSIYQTLGHNSTARDIVIKLLLQSQFTYTVGESFKDGANDLMQADTLLYGGAYAGIIQTAFYNRGVYSSPVPVELSGFRTE